MPEFKSKFSILYAVLGVLVLVIILAGFKVFLVSRTPKVETPELTYILSPTKTELKVGEKVSIPVYLTGKDASRVSAYDLKMFYDSTKFKPTKVTPGGFFDKYITVKWDQSQSWFALAQSPSNPRVPAQASLPVVTLELTAVAKVDSTQVATNASIVYLTKTGGFHPATGTVNFKIK